MNETDNSINIDKEISNNIGEQFKRANLESKQGTKLSRLKDSIDAAKLCLDKITLEDDIEQTREKVKALLTNLYSGRNLKNQFDYLQRKKTVLEMVTQAFSVVVAKQDAYDKAKSTFEQELEGV
jgi:hypothetical protein